jgi:hypothetical protein
MDFAVLCAQIRDQQVGLVVLATMVEVLATMVGLAVLAIIADQLALPVIVATGSVLALSGNDQLTESI